MTHPTLSRLIVSQDDYRVGVDVIDDPTMWVAAAQMMDDELERMTGYLSRDRRWSWIDRRHFFARIWHPDDT